MNKKYFLIFNLSLLFFLRSFSQIILAPDLQCVVTDASNGNITLYWTNPPANPCGAFVQYTIYASSTGSAGPYNTFAETNQAATSFVYLNAISISSTWYFYIEANYNCPGATVLQSDTVNNLNPSTPQIVNVDVTQNGNAVINWIPDSSPQTQGYVIYYYAQNGSVFPFDTVYGRFNTTTTDFAADPTSQSVSYTIAAFDSCDKFSSYNTFPHNTIYATPSSAACVKQITFNWNRYINWPQGVKLYEVWMSRNSGPFGLVALVDSGTLTYGLTNYNDGDSLCVFIRGISAADSNVYSNSNLMCMRASIVQPPAYNYITNITVDLANHVWVTWIIDVAGELIYYTIENSGNNLSFTNVAQLNAPSPLNPSETFVDSNVTPEHSPYFYRTTAVDSCQNQYTTAVAKTICLKGELFDYYIANLTWNDLEIDSAHVLRYNLYRNSGNGYQLIKTFLPGINAYSDSLQQLLTADGIFCYRIEAVYDLNLPIAGFNQTLSSFSNEQCIIHRPIIYIPNAFAPNGVNQIFKPTIIYGDPQGYTMTIFNRWGGKVFESNDPTIGWDGNDHGKEAQQGGYAYLIQFYANDGVKVERKGMVLLVK